MMALVGCIVVSTAMIVLYNREVKKRSIFIKGVNEISDYMGRKYPDLQILEDVDRIKVATNLSLRLTEENKKNKELQDAIDDILERLKQHWTVQYRRLYLIDMFKPPRTWQDCADYCAAKPFTEMINIESKAEEIYLESQLKGSAHDFWIGLYKRGDSWSWIDAKHKFREKHSSKGRYHFQTSGLPRWREDAETLSSEVSGIAEEGGKSAGRTDSPQKPREEHPGGLAAQRSSERDSSAAREAQ
nr:uncharacterized protein LOC118075297 [Zootoca vivipara]